MAAISFGFGLSGSDALVASPALARLGRRKSDQRDQRAVLDLDLAGVGPADP